MPQQPKFKDCVWDSAKDTSFRTWLCVFGGIVANYDVGPQLERFLDLFLLRDPQAATTQPSFLSDPVIRGCHFQTNFRMGPFEVLMSLVTHHHSIWVIGQKLRVKDWGVKLVLQLPSTTTTT